MRQSFSIDQPILSRVPKRHCLNPSFLFALFCLVPEIADSATSLIGLGYTNYEYKEELTAPAKSNELGGYLSLHFKYQTFLAEPYKSPSFLLSFDVAPTTDLTYDGSTLNTGSGSISPVVTKNKHSFYFLEAQGFYPVFDWATLYLGAGYRYWNRLLVYGTGYREIYTWFYWTLGAEFELLKFNDSRLSVDISSRPTFGGQMKIIFSEFVITGDDSNVNLGAKAGFRISLPFVVNNFLDRSGLTLRVEPWYEFSEIGQSNSVYNSTPVSGGGVLGYIYEPASKTRQYGLLTGLVFEI